MKDWHFGTEPLDWPLDEQGQREKAVLLTHTAGTGGEAEMTISLLSSCGIPAFAYHEHGVAGKVISGFSGFGEDIYVPQSQWEDAKNILEAQPFEQEEEL
ncbi:MAG: hypothetical protein IJS55_00400 [Oscillospiraceae bacterium]|nr:hypothetical protein [Oscillospiraceae bacterium]MBR0211748.1 hypothetical protein [Oscillospiraceae bacterium]